MIGWACSLDGVEDKQCIQNILLGKPIKKLI